MRLHWSRMRLERQMLLIGMGHDKPNVTKITSFRWNNVGIRVSPPFFKRVEERRRGSHAVFGFDRFYNFFFSFAALNDFKWCSTSVLDVTLDVSYDTCAKRRACDIEIQRRLPQQKICEWPVIFFQALLKCLRLYCRAREAQRRRHGYHRLRAISLASEPFHSVPR